MGKALSIENLPPIHYPNESDVDKTLFAPIFSRAVSCRCMMGYFTSNAFSELASSLAHFLRTKASGLQLIVSPYIDKEDLQALSDAIAADENLLPLLFPGIEITEELFQTATLKALTYLVVSGKLTIKIALMKGADFHAKIWLFETDCGRVAVHGSGNFTKKGLRSNFEQLRLDKDCPGSADSKYVIDSLEDRFNKIWGDHYPGLSVHELNHRTMSALKELNRNYEDEGYNVGELSKVLESLPEKEKETKPKALVIPEWLDYSTGDFAHQGEAIRAWEANSNKGILSIATGGGKTLTALVAASLVQHSVESMLLVIAVPTKILISQWEKEVRLFGVSPITSENRPLRNVIISLKDAIRNLKTRYSKIEVVVLSHELLKRDKVVNALANAKKASDLMLIADEVHNLGSEGFRSHAPDIFKYRLGLSATVERQFDEVGTRFLHTYFGPIVYEYSVEDAIGHCLVEFDYFVHRIGLLDEEMEEWIDLTYDIRRLSYASDLNDGDPDKERWKRLCLKRRRIIEGATSKAVALENILPDKNSDILRTLIFCTDKNPRQLELVNEILNDRGIYYHQITQAETSNKSTLSSLIESFSSGALQVLTSKRVLDEGFNVPQTEVAYLLASSTVRRQWVQRLGRVLRKSPSTNKLKAIIHDFVVTPHDEIDGKDEDLRSLVLGEISRVQFFSALSSNGMEEGGAVDLLEYFAEYLE